VVISTNPGDYQTFRIIYEITSAIICLLLVRFMIKPYQITGENRYIGLPLGFGLLGATYALSAFVYFQPLFLGRATIYIQLILRTFAFIFLSVTYFFSRKNAENNRWIWNTTLTLLIGVFLTLFVFVSIPDTNLPNYQSLCFSIRIINLILIGYICAHTLRSHLEKPDPETLWIPLGYILLAISQYALIIWALDESYSAFFSALAIRWIGLVTFLIVAYRSFYNPKKRVQNEENCT